MAASGWALPDRAAGHGGPIDGADRIRADIDTMPGAESLVRDYTLDGMNVGKTIWEEYAGWMHYKDGTTALPSWQAGRTPAPSARKSMSRPIVRLKRSI
jgi:hypothetical protein